MSAAKTYPHRGLGAWCTALAAVAVLVSLAGTAWAGDVVVIGNPALPVNSLSAAELKRIYVGDKGFVGEVKVEPLDYLNEEGAASVFLEGVVGMNPARFHAWWVKEVFHGGGIPPRRMDGVPAVVQAVAAQPGAIGYVPAESLAGVTTVKRLYTVSAP